MKHGLFPHADDPKDRHPDPGSGTDPGRGTDFDRFAEETLADYVRLAGRWIQALGIDAVRLAPAGAVAAAWAEVCEAIQDGRFAPDPTRDELL